MKVVEGSFKELTDPAFYQTFDREAFLHVLLTDQGVIPNMMNQLRAIYPNILSVERLNGHEVVMKERQQRLEKQSPQALSQQFFTDMTGSTFTMKQQQWLERGLAVANDTEKRDN